MMKMVLRGQFLPDLRQVYDLPFVARRKSEDNPIYDAAVSKTPAVITNKLD